MGPKGQAFVDEPHYTWQYSRTDMIRGLLD